MPVTPNILLYVWDGPKRDGRTPLPAKKKLIFLGFLKIRFFFIKKIVDHTSASDQCKTFIFVLFFLRLPPLCIPSVIASFSGQMTHALLKRQQRSQKKWGALKAAEGALKEAEEGVVKEAVHAVGALKEAVTFL
jgi:hypothetical protein